MSTATEAKPPESPAQIAKLSSLKADLKRESEGDWVTSFLWPETAIRYRVRALTYPPYRIERQLLESKHVRKYGVGRPIPPEVMSADIGRLFAKHILLEWDGFDVKYSREAALETLLAPDYRNIVRDIEFAATRLSDQEVEYVEEAGKN